MEIVSEIEKTKKVNLGEIFAQSNKEIENLEASLKKIKDFNNDPKNFIYESVFELKRQVDLRKEKLKEEIDTLSSKMILELENFQEKCYENIANVKIEEKTSDFLKKLQENLAEWTKEDKRKLLISDDSERKRIMSKAIELDKKILDCLNNWQCEVF